MTVFMATAGIVISLLDQNGISNEEQEQILRRMSELDLFPRDTYNFIVNLLEEENDPAGALMSIYHNAVDEILGFNPRLYEPLPGSVS